MGGWLIDMHRHDPLLGFCIPSNLRPFDYTFWREIRIPVCVGEKVVNKLPIHEVSGFVAFHELKQSACGQIPIHNCFILSNGVIDVSYLNDAGAMDLHMSTSVWHSPSPTGINVKGVAGWEATASFLLLFLRLLWSLTLPDTTENFL